MKKFQVFFGYIVIISFIFLPINFFVKNDLYTVLISVFTTLTLFRISPGQSQDYPFSFSLGLFYQGHSE
ncbi:hypothetical protein IGI73_002103 [Enterococcus sp. DIV0755f]